MTEQSQIKPNATAMKTPLQGNGKRNKIAEIHPDVTRQLTTFRLEDGSKTIHIPRGQRVTIGAAEGHGCIQQIWMTMTNWFWGHWAPEAVTSQTILKTLILRIYWDGEEIPAVQAPVGDFFGNGLCCTSNFASTYFGMSSGGFFCKFPMPFRKGFRIEMENLDEHVDTSVFMNVLYQVPETPPTESEGYFHAQFQSRSDILGTKENPVEILHAEGTGHLVGCALSMQGKVRNNISFLEAPEQISIDENWDTPRIMGTGLEDYFLGGWYFKEGEYIGGLSGVPEKDYFNSSVAMYRIHEADAIRFRERIDFRFVNFADYRLQPFSYSSVAFHYLDRPGGTDFPLPDCEALLCWYRMRETDHWTTP